jgi:hypothetical protein
MTTTHTPGLLGSVLTFTLLLTAGGTWFTANTLSSHAPDVVATISQVSLVAGVLAVVAFGLTLRSLLSSDGPTREGRRDYRRPSQ